MLLRQEASDGVVVLCVRGPVEDSDTAPLVSAVQQALAAAPRAVVLDLAEVSAVSGATRDALSRLPELADGRSVASLVVRPPAALPEVAGWVRASDGDGVRLDRRAWPRTRIEVDHSAQGPAQARAAVTSHADALQLGPVQDDVVLLVSEMVTNAVRYAAPPVHLEISAGDEDVVVAVSDGSTARPRPRPVDDDAEGGRGMMLVDMLTADHGVRTDPPGKAVWARLRRGAPGS